MSIQVGKHLIGPGNPTFIIAEIGSNWTSLEDCLHSIIQAKLCGADAVKFQLFDCEALYGPLQHISNNNPAKKEFIKTWEQMKYALPIDWLPKLKAESDRVGIEFMCTAFSPELYDVVDPFVSIHKVASAELTHKRILEKLKALGKPVILSTGACTESEIGHALEILTPHRRFMLENHRVTGSEPNFEQTILMYCVAAYPARIIDLSTIETLKNTFEVIVGYSDHSTDVLEIPNGAVAFGASVIEKHVTFIDAVTPDSPHSVNADEFKLTVKSIRTEWDGIIGPTPAEKSMITRHKRRLIATKDIQPGDTLVEGTNFGIYRSLKDESKAMHGFSVDEVKGRVAQNLILAGDGISRTDLV